MSGAARCAAGPVEKIRDELLTVARQYQELADRLKRARTAASDPSTMRSAITSVKHIRDDAAIKPIVDSQAKTPMSDATILSVSPLF
jgi:hypothetical protein